MPGQRRGRPPLWVGLLGLLCLTGSGCQTLGELPSISSLSQQWKHLGTHAPQKTAPPAAAPTQAVLATATEVIWTVRDTKGQNGAQPVQGKSVVDGNGYLSLGPYGSIPVGGFTPQQASDAINKHMERFFSSPRTHIAARVGRPADAVPNVFPQPAGPAVARLGAPQRARGGVVPVQYQSMPKGEPGVTRADLTSAVPEAAGTAPPPPGIDPMGAGDTEQLPQPRKGTSKEGDNGKDEKAGSGAPPATTVPAGLAGPGPHPHHPPEEMRKILLPPYVIEPPDILLVEVSPKLALEDQPIGGQHLVRPDGSINLGIYGSVVVAGLTLDQARAVIYNHLRQRLTQIQERDINVDVLAYNSKVYYVITDGAGLGEQVFRLPITGNETVLDAIGQIQGLPPVASKRRIWVARRSHGEQACGQVLPVDWIGITQRGCIATNYQIMPGDRVYVNSDGWRKFNNNLDKVVTPVERLLGVTLLGSQTVNSISGRNQGNQGGGF